MPKDEKTSPKVGKIAAKKLADPKTPKEVKSLAGSVLTQLSDKKGQAPKKEKK